MERPITLEDIQYYLRNAQVLGSVMQGSAWADNTFAVNAFATVTRRIIEAPEFTHSESQDPQEIW